MDKAKLIGIAGVITHSEPVVTEALDGIVSSEIQRVYNDTVPDVEQLNVVASALRQAARSLYEVIYKIECEADRSSGYQVSQSAPGVPTPESA